MFEEVMGLVEGQGQMSRRVAVGPSRGLAVNHKQTRNCRLPLTTCIYICKVGLSLSASRANELSS